MGYNYVRAVSRLEGYCMYGTKQLRLRWTAYPIQIRAHHHIDVYTDISDARKEKFLYHVSNVDISNVVSAYFRDNLYFSYPEFCVFEIFCQATILQT